MNRFRTLLLVCAMAAVVGAPVASAAPKGKLNCLRAQSADGPAADASTCVGDPLRIGQHQTVLNAIEALGLGATKITFVGCKGSIFATEQSKKHEYKVFYKVVPLRTPAEQFNHLLPVMHELAHVFQIEQYGGYGKLTKALGIAQIELGADFVAGALYHWRWNAPNTSAFDKSMELLGDYGSGNLDDHGRPEDRTAAFQFGFEYPLTGQGRDIHFAAQAVPFRDAHAKFQADIYGQIVEFRE